MAKRYFILSEQAHSFTDMKSGLSLSGKNVGEVESKDFKSSKTSTQALQKGYLKEITESEAVKLKKKNGQAAAEVSIANQALLKAEKDRKKLEKLNGPASTPEDDEEDEEAGEEIPEEEEEEEEEDDEEEEEEEEEDDDNDPSNLSSKRDYIDAITKNAKIPAESKKGLKKLSLDDLKKVLETGK